jgi:hypothetical protein
MYFLIGLTLICGVSLWDDVVSLPNRVRNLPNDFDFIYLRKADKQISWGKARIINL